MQKFISIALKRLVFRLLYNFNKHGEGIHHLAVYVDDMDQVLEDYTSKNYVISMG